jgi:hypothetical protein
MGFNQAFLAAALAAAFGFAAQVHAQQTAPAAGSMRRRTPLPLITTGPKA